MTSTRPPTQVAQVLALLRQRGADGITAMDALNEVGCFRLAARISDLHDDGHDIRATMETTRSGKRVARYVLHEGPAQLGLAL